MKKSMSSSHRFSCIAFATAVIASLYSIGSLVYGSDPIVAQVPVATPGSSATINIASASDTSTLSMPMEEFSITEEHYESGNEEHDAQEPWPADVLAEIAGKRESDAVVFDADQPPVSSDNVHAEPTGEFAEQILAGEMHDTPFDGEAFGFDPDMEQPHKDNAGLDPKLEFADQIRQEDIANTAALSGYQIDSESYIELKEVDDASAPPTETGASIDPKEFAQFDEN